MIRSLIARAKGGNAASPTHGAEGGKSAAAAKIKSKAQRGEKASALLGDDSTLGALSSSQFEALYKAFVKFGVSRPGYLTVKELGPFLRSLGDFPRTRELLDLAGNLGDVVYMDFPEVCLLVSMRSKHRYDAEQVIEAFVLFDPERTGSVRVSVFRNALQHLAGLTDEELDDICKEAVALSRGEANRRRDLELAKKQAKEEAKAAAAARRAKKAREAEEAQRKKEASTIDAGDAKLRINVAAEGSTRRPSLAGAGTGASPVSDVVAELFGAEKSAAATAGGSAEEPSVLSPASSAASPVWSPPAIPVKGSEGFSSSGGPAAPAGPSQEGDPSSHPRPRATKHHQHQQAGEEEADPWIYYEVVVRTMFSY